MKHRILQVIVVVIGIAALAFLLGEPHLEGRNAHATLFEVYFKDPFLAYAYIASIPFFAALRQAFKVLGYAGEGNLVSLPAVTALRTLKRSAIAFAGFAAVGELVILLGESDDRAGGVVVGLLVTVGSLVVAAAAATWERALRNARDTAK